MERYPFMIDLAVTRRCNLRCIYCTSRDDSSTVIDVNKFKKYLRKIRKPIKIWVTGGEPLLVRFVHGFREIIGTDINAKLDYLGMSTNGTLINRDIARKLVTNYDLILISIHGRKELHERITQVKGSYEKSLDALKLLIKTKENSSSDIKIGVSTVLMSESIERIKDFFDYLIGLGIDVILFKPMLYDPTDELYIKHGLKPEHATLIKECYDYLKSKNKLVPWFNDYYLHRMINYVKRIPEPPPFCGYGEYFVYISPEGKIYPCCRIKPRYVQSYTIEDEVPKEVLLRRLSEIRQIKIDSCSFCMHGYNSQIVYERYIKVNTNVTS